MKLRVDAGTDIAMLGAWDAARRDMTSADISTDQRTGQLEREAQRGDLLLIDTAADGGGPVDIYVDEEIPDDARSQLVATGPELLLVIRSGKLAVDGIENYRPGNGTAQVVDIPPGAYAVRCHEPADPERSAPEDALVERVGAGELAYYDRRNNLGCLGGASMLLLFPVLVVPMGWKLALPIALAAAVGWFPLNEWFLRRNPRYQRLEGIITPFRIAHETATLVLEMRSFSDPAGLVGGTVRIGAARSPQAGRA